MDDITELNLKQKLQNLSWQKAREILLDADLNVDDEFHALRKYELQSVIYQQLKICYGLK